MKNAEVLDLQKLAHKILAITTDCEEGATPARYEQTRSSWKLSPARANEADYVFSVTRGIVKAIYKVDSKGWRADALREKRYLFEGSEVTDPEITDLYLGKMIERKKGQANPIQYLYGASAAKNDIPSDAVVINPKNPTEITSSEFENNKTLTSIIIPNTVTSIGYSAFSSCASLKSVIIPNSVTTIDDEAFSFSGLTSITIPDSVVEIGHNVFEECRDLTSIILSYEANFTFQDGILYNKECSQIIAVLYNVKEVIIPEGIDEIPSAAFQERTSLKKVTLPSSLGLIGDFAFSQCANLESVEFAQDSQLDHIGEGAFQNCVRLTRIALPSSITVIEYGAFENCESLEWVDFSPESDEVQAEGAFRGCLRPMDYDSINNLRELFGDQDIFGEEDDNEDDDEEDEDYDPYDGEDNDEDTNGDDEDEDEFYIDDFGVKYSGNKKILLEGNPELTEYTILEGTQKIEYRAFADSALESIIIPDSVTEIGGWAFHGSSIESITLPDSIEIGWGAFVECHSLTEIKIPENMTVIPSNMFRESGLENVILHNKITRIEEEAFSQCALTSVTLPSSLQFIGELAFQECSFTSLEIPESVSTIGNFAFAFCNQLESVKMANDVDTGKGVFNNCENLNEETREFLEDKYGDYIFEGDD